MTQEEIGARIGEIIADAREAGVSDKAIIEKLAKVIEALKEGLSRFQRSNGHGGHSYDRCVGPERSSDHRQLADTPAGEGAGSHD
jgi:hypothetical protein